MIIGSLDKKTCIHTGQSPPRLWSKWKYLRKCHETSKF